MKTAHEKRHRNHAWAWILLTFAFIGIAIAACTGALDFSYKEPNSSHVTVGE